MEVIILILIPPLFFVPKMLPAFYICCMYSSVLQTRFLSWKQSIWALIRLLSLELSDLGPYCLQSSYRLPKNISRWDNRRQKSWLAGKGLSFTSYCMTTLCHPYHAGYLYELHSSLIIMSPPPPTHTEGEEYMFLVGICIGIELSN